MKSLLFCALLFTTGHTVAQYNYVISGNLTNGAGKTLYFSPDTYIANTGKQKADSIVIADDDSFKLSGKIRYPGIYSLFLGDQKAFLAFYLDNTPVTISGSANAIYRSAVAGSEDQRLMTGFYTKDGIIQQQLEESLGLAQKASKSLDTPSVSIYKRKIDSLNQLRRVHINSFIHDHPASYQTLGILENFLGNLVSYEQAEKQMLPLSKKYSDNPLFIKVTKLIAGHKLSIAGTIMPDIILPDTTGKNLVNVKMIRTLNKYVLIDFWASWCVPCRTNNPALQELYAKYKKQKLAVVGVSLDRDMASWKKAIRMDKTSWWHLSDLKGMDSRYALMFNVQTLPTYMLIDTSGKLILNTHNIKEISDKIALLF